MGVLKVHNALALPVVKFASGASEALVWRERGAVTNGQMIGCTR